MLDAEQPVVNQLMMGATEGEQVALGVVPSVAEILQMVDVQSQTVAAARHLTPVPIALEHGSAHGGRDGA